METKFDGARNQSRHQMYDLGLFYLVQLGHVADTQSAGDELAAFCLTTPIVLQRDVLVVANP